MHHGGFPRMRTFHCKRILIAGLYVGCAANKWLPLVCLDAYDLSNSKFACFSTKATVILSDMTTIEKGPFAVIVGSVRRQRSASCCSYCRLPAC